VRGHDVSHTATLVRPPTSPHAGIDPRLVWPMRVLWVALVGVVVGGSIIGAPYQFRSMLVPAANLEETVSLGRLLPEEQAGIEALGVPMEVLVLELETVALGVVAICLAVAILIHLSRRDSWVAWVASLFLVFTSCAATFNVDALARAHPAASGLLVVLSLGCMVLPALLLFLFPGGGFVPPWSRWLLAIWVASMTGQALAPGVIGQLGQRTDTVGYMLAAVVFMSGVWAQVHRYRRISTPLERQQTKWVVVVFAVQVMVFVVITLTLQVVPGIFASPVANQLYETAMFHLYEVTFLLFPVAFLIAIFRYRLWDIDFIINRSLVYGALTAFMVLMFAVALLAVRQGMLLVTDGQHLSVALGVALLAVGLLFLPSRRFLHNQVNRRLYGIEIEVGFGVPRSREPQPRAASGDTLTSLGDLADYEDLELIGRGGMADVYRARHGETGRTVAIKVLPGERTRSSPDLVQRFEREAGIVARLEHPNIVKLHDHGALDDGTHYMVMELVEGMDLADLLADIERLSVAESLPLLQDITGALDYAHTEGVVHRDIKPSNVLLDTVAPPAGERSPRAVLTDFGIARVDGSTALTRTDLVGTLDYIAPEQIQDSAQVDGRADIYSLGVVAFQMVTGVRPFRNDNPVALMLAHLQQPPPDPREFTPQLPAPVAEAILRALAKDPDRRYTTPAEMMRALDRAS
jgi:tRNA A-37 threonylcarbamoyl transferase component Bud32